MKTENRNSRIKVEKINIRSVPEMKKLVTVLFAVAFVLIPMTAVPAIAGVIIPKAEMVFVVDVSGSMSPQINNLRNNVRNFVQELNSRDIEAKLGLITYSDITAKPAGDGTLDSTTVHTSGGSVWMNVDEFITALNRIVLLNGGDLPEAAIDGLGFLVQKESPIIWSKDTHKFAFLITDAETKDNSNWTVSQRNQYGPHNRWGYEYLSDIAADLKLHGIFTSVIAPTSFSNHYRPLYEQTDGTFINLASNFSVALNTLIDEICKVIFTWTVEFVDWDGKVLDTQEIIDGKAATAPVSPKRVGYVFVGWDKDFSNVTEDMTITAQYEEGECLGCNAVSCSYLVFVLFGLLPFIIARRK